MAPEQAEKLIEKLLKYDSRELGIFISMLSKAYIDGHQITKEQFIASLSNSIDKLNEK